MRFCGSSDCGCEAQFHGSQIDRLRAQLGRPDADVDELRAILRRSGAEASARADAERFCDDALRALDSPLAPERVADQLRAIAIYAVRRAL